MLEIDLTVFLIVSVACFVFVQAGKHIVGRAFDYAPSKPVKVIAPVLVGALIMPFALTDADSLTVLTQVLLGGIAGFTAGGNYELFKSVLERRAKNG